MLAATCMQQGESREAVMMVQGAAVGPVSPAAAAAPSPPLATASAVAQAHWRRRPQNKSRAASTCLRQPECNGVRAEQPLRWCKGLLSAQFSPAAAAARSSHSERRSSSPLAPPPAKQVPGGFSMLTATCMQRGESRAAVMVMQGAAVGPVLKVAARQRRDDCELELGE